MEGYASRSAVEAACENWSDAVLKCRMARKHEYRPVTAFQGRWGYLIRERCSRRCGVERTWSMDLRGYRVDKPKPVYPKEGYLLKGLGRVDEDGQAAIRLAWLRTIGTIREMPEEEE